MTFMILSKKKDRKKSLFFNDKKNKYDNHKESVNKKKMKMTGTNKENDDKRRFRKKPKGKF